MCCRDLLRDIADLRDYDALLHASRAFLLRRKLSHSFTVNVLSVALYELFAANDGQSFSSVCYKIVQLKTKKL